MSTQAENDKPAASIATARVIDLHAHVVLAETIGAAGESGPFIGENPDGSPYFQIGKSYRLNGVRYAGGPFMDVDLRLERMAARGIDFQLLTPNPLTYLHFVPAADAIKFCRIHNDALAKIVASHPDRFAGFAALPMQDPTAARQELIRSVKELGLIGAAFGTDMPFSLHDAALDPLYETAIALDVPLSVHPAPAGIDGPAGDPALRNFELDIVAGFAAQETLSVATLVFGGVIHRHPGLDLLISHGGGGAALLMGRMSKAARKRPWSPAHLRAEGAFEDQVRRLWFDIHLEHPQVLALLADVVGREHLVYGTNFAGWDEPDTDEHSVVEPILADNARRLLRAR